MRLPASLTSYPKPTGINLAIHLLHCTTFPLDGTNREQTRMIRRYNAWRNGRLTDPKLREVIKRASTIKRAKVV